MSKLLQNIYSVADLYVVKIRKDYLDNKNETNDIKYFNTDFLLIVEKFTLDSKEDGKIAFESYEECFTGADIFIREDINKNAKNPVLFEFIKELPKEYLTEEEIKTGKIGTLRLFQIFQILNCQNLHLCEDLKKEEEKGKKKILTRGRKNK